MEIYQRNYLNYNENTFSPKQKRVEVRSFLALGGAREFHESYFERPCACDPNFAWQIFLFFSPNASERVFPFVAKICLLGSVEIRYTP